MPADNPQRLKSYLEMISSKQNLEKILAASKSKTTGGGGLEGMESPVAGAARSGLETVLRGKDPSGDIRC